MLLPELAEGGGLAEDTDFDGRRPFRVSRRETSRRLESSDEVTSEYSSKVGGARLRATPPCESRVMIGLREGLPKDTVAVLERNR